MKKVINAITTVVAIIAIAIMCFTIVAVTVFNRNDKSLFGYKMFIVLTDSMKDTFQAGDIVLVKQCDTREIQVGDIISYISTDPDNAGKIVTHKVRKIEHDRNGDPIFTTYGTTTDVDDRYQVTAYQVCGKYMSHIPKVGTFFSFLKTTQGYIACILTPFVILIVSQIISTVKLFKQYKKEQMEEIEKEKKRIEAQKAETQAMLEQIRKLRAQMESQNQNGQ